MCIFFGLILMMDLRLVGWANLRSRAAEISARLLPWQMVGFVIMVISGVLLVWAQPLRYYGKTFFWWKMGLMALAGVNAGIIHLITTPLRSGVGQRRRQVRRRRVDRALGRGAGARPAGRLRVDDHRVPSVEELRGADAAC